MLGEDELGWGFEIAAEVVSLDGSISLFENSGSHPLTAGVPEERWLQDDRLSITRPEEVVSYLRKEDLNVVACLQSPLVTALR